MAQLDTYRDDDNSVSDRLSWGPILAATFTSLAIVTVVSAWPQAGQPVGVLFPPWVQTQAVFEQVHGAGGTVIEFGNTTNIVIALGQSDDFFSRLFSTGALVIFDGTLANALCTTPRD